jgi:signal transduction histidine kinase
MGMDTKRTGPDWVDMKALSQSLLETHARRAEGQRVTIDLSLTPEPAFVIGYRDLLRSALDRLVVGALDSMRNGGVLTLKVYRDRHVVVECCDTGRGGLTSTTSPKQVMQAHGGCLLRRTLPHGGACFIAELPAAGPRTVVAA